MWATCSRRLAGPPGGSFLGRFWLHFWSILDLFWSHFRNIFCNIFELVLGRLQGEDFRRFVRHFYVLEPVADFLFRYSGKDRRWRLRDSPVFLQRSAREPRRLSLGFSSRLPRVPLGSVSRLPRVSLASHSSRVFLHLLCASLLSWRFPRICLGSLPFGYARSAEASEAREAMA